MKKWITVKPETKQEVSKMKEAIERISGKKVTYDFVIRFLMSYFRECDKKEGVNPDSAISMLLKEKRDFVIGKTEKNSSTITMEEVARNFYYIPDKYVKLITKNTPPGKTPVAFLIQLIDNALLINGKFLGILNDKKVEKELREFLNSVSGKEGKEFITTVQKRFNKMVELTLKEYKKKLKKRKKR